MGKCISFGECDKNFIYLYIVTFIAIFVSTYSLCIAKIYKLNSFLSFSKGEHFNNISLRLFLTYIAISLFFFIELILNKCSFRKRRINNRRNPINIQLSYIFNDYDSSEIITKKDFIKIVFLSLLLIGAEILRFLMGIIFNQITFIDYFSSLLFLSFILSICRNKYYRHQYFSIITILIMKIFIYVIQGIQNKSMKNLKDQLYQFIFQIIASLMESLFLMYIKLFMKYNYYFSPFRTLYFIGIINTVLIIIFNLIIFCLNCFNIETKFCLNPFKLDTTTSCLNSFKIETFFSVFKEISIIHIGFLFYMIFIGVYNFLIFYTINKYTVFHSIILIINGKIYLPSTNIGKDIYIIILNIFYSLIIVFCYLVFLEFIELNCCGLSENTRKNIQKRANEDPFILNENQIDINSSSLTEEDSIEEKNEIKNVETINESF